MREAVINAILILVPALSVAERDALAASLGVAQRARPVGRFKAKPVAMAVLRALPHEVVKTASQIVREVSATGFAEKAIRNALEHHAKAGRVNRVERGAYRIAPAGLQSITDAPAMTQGDTKDRAPSLVERLELALSMVQDGDEVEVELDAAFAFSLLAELKKREDDHQAALHQERQRTVEACARVAEAQAAKDAALSKEGAVSKVDAILCIATAKEIASSIRALLSSPEEE